MLIETYINPYSINKYCKCLQACIYTETIIKFQFLLVKKNLLVHFMNKTAHLNYKMAFHQG